MPDGVKVKTLKSSVTKIQPFFFFNKCLPGFCKLLISFQSSDKIDFNSFSKFICCFVEGQAFRVPCSAIFTSVTLTIGLLKIHNDELWPTKNSDAAFVFSMLCHSTIIVK